MCYQSLKSKRKRGKRKGKSTKPAPLQEKPGLTVWRSRFLGPDGCLLRPSSQNISESGSKRERERA